MQRIFIDTNILIYYFSTDAIKSPLAEKLLNDPQYKFVTSTQVLSEFLSVIIRKQICDVYTALKHLDRIILLFEISDFDIRDLRDALALKSKYKLAYYDSLIIITALKGDCTILYSEDMHHKLKIEKKLTIINPFK